MAKKQTKKVPVKMAPKKTSTKEIIKKEPVEIKPQEQAELTPETVRKYLVSGGGKNLVTDQEVMMFLKLCKYQNLNPFLKEAYLIKYNSDPATIVVGKDTFTKRAQKNENFRGYKAGVIVSKESIIYREGSMVLPGEKLIGGWAEVFVNGWIAPVRAEVSLSEYIGSPKSSWGTKPATMIRKVALVQALREAFPTDFQGLYDAAEMNIEIPTEQKIVTETAAPEQKPEPPKEKPSGQKEKTFSDKLIDAGNLLLNPVFSDADRDKARPLFAEIRKAKDVKALNDFVIIWTAEKEKREKKLSEDAEKGFEDMKPAQTSAEGENNE